MNDLIELLPLPEKSEIDRHLPTGVRVYGYTASDMKTYARACVAHATTAKDAEIEALRAEVKDYRTNGAAAVRFAPSSAHWSEELRRLFGDDARTGIEVLENRHRQELARAERLAEALRLYMSAGFGNSTDFYKQAEAKRAATEVLHPTAAQDGK